MGRNSIISRDAIWRPSPPPIPREVGEAEGIEDRGDWLIRVTHLRLPVPQLAKVRDGNDAPLGGARRRQAGLADWQPLIVPLGAFGGLSAHWRWRTRECGSSTRRGRRETRVPPAGCKRSSRWESCLRRQPMVGAPPSWCFVVWLPPRDPRCGPAYVLPGIWGPCSLRRDRGGLGGLGGCLALLLFLVHLALVF